jgi:hypothetical protein
VRLRMLFALDCQCTMKLKLLAIVNLSPPVSRRLEGIFHITGSESSGQMRRVTLNTVAYFLLEVKIGL